MLQHGVLGETCTHALCSLEPLISPFELLRSHAIPPSSTVPAISARGQRPSHFGSLKERSSMRPVLPCVSCWSSMMWCVFHIFFLTPCLCLKGPRSVHPLGPFSPHGPSPLRSLEIWIRPSRPFTTPPSSEVLPALWGRKSCRLQSYIWRSQLRTLRVLESWNPARPLMVWLEPISRTFLQPEPSTLNASEEWRAPFGRRSPRSGA